MADSWCLVLWRKRSWRNQSHGGKSAGLFIYFITSKTLFESFHLVWMLKHLTKCPESNQTVNVLIMKCFYYETNTPPPPKKKNITAFGEWISNLLFLRDIKSLSELLLGNHWWFCFCFKQWWCEKKTVGWWWRASTTVFVTSLISTLAVWQELPRLPPSTYV